MCISPQSLMRMQFEWDAELKGQTYAVRWPYLIGYHGQSAIKVFYQLFKSWPVCGNRMPAVFHHQVSGKIQLDNGIIMWRQHEIIHICIKSYCAQFISAFYLKGPYISWVQAEGLSMRWPSRSNLKSSSTGTPGYGEPPRVKISHRRTPKDHLQQENTQYQNTTQKRNFYQIRALIWRYTELKTWAILHVTLMCVNSVKQSLRCHPFDRQPALKKK